MQIYVRRNEQTLGPYLPAELQTRLATGEFAEEDFAWHVGLEEWQPISQVLRSISYGFHRTLPPSAGPSGFAKASFIISLAGIAVWFVTFIVAAVSEDKGSNASSPTDAIVGFAVLAGLVSNIVGIIFAIMALTKPASNKWMAVSGLVINIAELGGVIVLAILGAVMG
jgi:GYF domain 2